MNDIKSIYFATYLALKIVVGDKHLWQQPTSLVVNPLGMLEMHKSACLDSQMMLSQICESVMACLESSIIIYMVKQN